MNQCEARGCSGRTAGYSRLCSAHAKRKRRHGAYNQQGITTGRLKPSLDLVRSYIARHGGDALWAKLEALWAASVREARGIVAEAHSGRPFFRPRAFAAAELIRVAESANPRVIIATVAAMAILQHREPGSFVSDDAARMQTARRFRCLSPVTKRRYVGARGVQTVTRDLRMDVAIMLGRMLHEALGAVGLRIAEQVEKERERYAVAHQEAYAALRAQVA